MIEESSTSRHQHVAVIGGGIAGLTAAYRLLQRGYRVTLWEQSSRLGGLAAAFDVPGGQLEMFYHHLFMSDRAISELIEELGIGESLAWLPSQNSYYSDGHIYSLASPFDLLRLPVVPFIDRIRIGLVTLYLQRITPQGQRWKQFERITAWEWLRRYLGERAFSRTLGAQLRAKFGPRAEEIAMVWFWNKIYLRTQSRPGLFGRERLGYIMGSFNVLIDNLEAACTRLGGDVRTGTGITGIEKLDSVFRVTGQDGTTEMVDAVVVTTPAPVLAKLFPDLPDDYRDKLLSTRYQGAACLVLRMNRQLSDSYWLNIADPEMPFTVMVEHTNFIPPEHYDGNHYLYVNTYIEPDHRYAHMPEDELVDEYLSYLTRINPKFDRSWVEEHWLFRTATAQPVVGLFYSDRIPEHRTPIEGVYLATMTQIYPEDRGTNYAVELGNEVAELVHADLSRQVACQSEHPASMV